MPVIVAVMVVMIVLVLMGMFVIVGMIVRTVMAVSVVFAGTGSIGLSSTCLDARLALPASTNSAHQSTSICFILSSSPPVICSW